VLASSAPISFNILRLGKNYAVINYEKLTYAGNLRNLKAVAENPNYRFVRGDICDAVVLEAAMCGSQHLRAGNRD